jgi:hypothetical protein
MEVAAYSTAGQKAKVKGFTTARRSRNQSPSPQRPQRAQRYAGKAKAGIRFLGKNRRRPRKPSQLATISRAGHFFPDLRLFALIRG